MNEFKESLKVDLEEQKQYEEHKRKRYEKLIQHPKWENARKRMKEDER
jgi:hypothetical protein